MRLDPDGLLDAFAGWHTDRRNRYCHDAGLPLISFAVLGSLAHVGIAGTLDLGMVLLAATLVFDLVVWRAQALGVCLMGGVLWWLGRATPLPLLGGAFVAGWALQLVGHRVYERNSPAFTTNLVHLVVGPRWLVRRWWRAARRQAP